MYVKKLFLIFIKHKEYLLKPQPDPAQIFVLEQFFCLILLTKILRDDSTG